MVIVSELGQMAPKLIFENTDIPSSGFLFKKEKKKKKILIY